MEKTVQNLLQCLRNVICGEDVPLIAMSETEQEKFYQMSLAQDMAHLISAAVGKGENHIISEKYRKRFRQREIWQSIGIRVRSWHWKRFELFLSSRRFFSFL